VVRTSSAGAYSSPLPAFPADNVGEAAPQSFTAPDTHQDQGSSRVGQRPFRSSRTRKSSVPYRVQMFLVQISWV